MDTLYSLLKIVSMMATGAFGVMALLTKYKDEKGKMTAWGKVAIGGIVVSSAVSLSMYLLETSKAKAAAEKAKVEVDATKRQLQVIQLNAETTAAAQEKSLQEAQALKSDLKESLAKSNDIARNLDAAVTELDKNAQTTSAILNADLNKLDFLEVTFVLVVDPLSFTDEKGHSLISDNAQRLLRDDAQTEIPNLNLSTITFDLQRKQSRVHEVIFADWYFRFFLYRADAGNALRCDQYSGQVSTRQGDYGVSSFTISTTSAQRRLGFGVHQGYRAVEFVVTYTIPPDRIAGFRMYQDLNNKTWGINLKTDPNKFRVKLITLTANGSIFSKKSSELSTEKRNLKFQVPSDSVGFYEGCTLIPRNFYGL